MQQKPNAAARPALGPLMLAAVLLPAAVLIWTARMAHCDFELNHSSP